MVEQADPVFQTSGNDGWKFLESLWNAWKCLEISRHCLKFLDVLWSFGKLFEYFLRLALLENLEARGSRMNQTQTPITRSSNSKAYTLITSITHKHPSITEKITLIPIFTFTIKTKVNHVIQVKIALQSNAKDSNRTESEKQKTTITSAKLN